MDIYVKMSFFQIFSIFLVFKHDFIRCPDFTIIALQTYVVMTLQFRLHIEYLMETYYILVLIYSQN